MGNAMTLSIKLYNCLGTEHPVSEYSIGLGYLKTNCTGADIEIVTDRWQLKDCDLIGLSAVADGVKEAIDILQSTSIPVVIGGQCTLWKGLKDYPFFYIIRGEGERALQNFIDLGGDYTGIHQFEGRRTIEFYNIPNLDDLNFPDRGRCAEIVPIITSRGCPYNCNFCSSQKYWGKPRYVSAEYFLDEVEYCLDQYRDMKFLYILDDLFMSDKQRFERIYERWMLNMRFKDLAVGGFVRSNLITKRTAQMLKDMGWHKLRFGAESGSDRILKLLNKTTTVEDNQRCIEIGLEAGLKVSFSMMWHVPGETVEDRRLTGEFLKKNLCRPGVSIEGNYHFRPYPGTKFYNGESLLEGEWNTRGAA